MGCGTGACGITLSQGQAVMTPGRGAGGTSRLLPRTSSPLVNRDRRGGLPGTYAGQPQLGPTTGPAGEAEDDHGGACCAACALGKPCDGPAGCSVAPGAGVALAAPAPMYVDRPAASTAVQRTATYTGHASSPPSLYTGRRPVLIFNLTSRQWLSMSPRAQMQYLQSRNPWMGPSEVESYRKTLTGSSQMRPAGLTAAEEMAMERDRLSAHTAEMAMERDRLSAHTAETTAITNTIGSVSTAAGATINALITGAFGLEAQRLAQQGQIAAAASLAASSPDLTEYERAKAQRVEAEVKLAQANATAATAAAAQQQANLQSNLQSSTKTGDEATAPAPTPTWVWVAGGAAALAVLAGGAYYLSGRTHS